MRLAMAMLADAANTREQLLNVLSAGITQVSRSEYPASMGVALALSIYLDESDLTASTTPHLRVAVRSRETGEVVAELIGDFAIEVNSITSAGSYLNVPISLADVSLPTPGAYSLDVEFAGLDPVEIKFDAALAAVVAPIG